MVCARGHNPGTVYLYSYGRQNWFEAVGEEHRATRERAGLFDLSSFGKAFIEGPDAEEELRRICANDVAVPVGKIVYTQMLNSRGGIVADLTFTRLAADRYMMVTAAASQSRDVNWVRRNLDKDAFVTVTDVSSGFAVLSIMGSISRALLQKVSNTDFSNAAFPFGTAQEIELGYGKAYALRVTYVGELGWELYIPTEFAGPMFDLLIREGRAFELKLAGYHALEPLRSEKGYRHFGHDVTPADTPLEAGLSFAVSFKKNADFIGRQSVEKQKAEGLNRRLIFLRLDDPEPTLLHDEPIWRDGSVIGRTSSGAFGYTVGASVAMGYVKLGKEDWKRWLTNGVYEVEIAGSRFAASCSPTPFYDPQNTRVRA